MTRKTLSQGLREKSLRRQLKEQKIEDNAAAIHSHALAVEAHKDWLRRRIAEALTKVDGKPEAALLLARLQKRATEAAGLSHRQIRLLMVIENRLAKNEDVVAQEPQRRAWIPSKRPEWMRDAALLPKRPPGK